MEVQCFQNKLLAITFYGHSLSNNCDTVFNSVVNSQSQQNAADNFDPAMSTFQDLEFKSC